jgi:hypothetical protein
LEKSAWRNGRAEPLTDQLTLLNAFDALASTYTEGGRFCRNTQTIL